jgi:prophage regulatory protein
MLIRLPEVMKRTALSRSQIYDLMERGEFPRSVKITGARSVAWAESEIVGWIAALLAEREAA